MFPNSVLLYNICGAVYTELGQFDLAIENYKKALLIKPDHADAFCNIGIAFQKKGELEIAIQNYKKAIKINPLHASAHYNMGISYKTKGDPEDAIICYKKAIKVQPSYAEAYNNMGTAFRDLNKLVEAINCFKWAVEIKPAYVEAHYNMGNALQELTKLEEAVEVYKKVLFFQPDHAEAYFHMGFSLQGQGKLDEAIVAYNKALSFKPNHADTYYNMGIAFQGQGKLDDAILAFHEARSLKPNSAAVYNNLANVLQEQGKLEEAITTFNKAIDIEPDHDSSHLNLWLIKTQLIDLNFENLTSKKDENNSLNDTLEQNPLYQMYQSILSFISADFRLSEAHLKSYKKAAQTSVFNTLNEKNKTFCTAYFKFLSHLIENSIFPKKSNIPNIYHIGESHCLSYAHSNISIDGRLHVVKPRITFGAKAHHFSNNTENQFKAIMSLNLNKIPNRSTVFISLGEIDCRADEGIIPASEKTGKPINEIIDETVKGYVNWFLNKNKNSQHKYYFFNVPAPIYNLKLSKALNNKVAEVVGQFNESLLKQISISESRLLNLYEHTNDLNGFSNGLYHCDGIHLDSKIIPQIQDQFNTQNVLLTKNAPD